MTKLHLTPPAERPAAVNVWRFIGAFVYVTILVVALYLTL
jgi:hypothetical protein